MYNNIIEKINNLCGPANFYFHFALVSIIFSILYQLFNKNEFKDYNSMILYYLIRIMFLLLFTFLLNWLCSIGLINLSWFLLYYPAIIFIILFISVIIIVTKLNKNDFKDILKNIKN